MGSTKGVALEEAMDEAKKALRHGRCKALFWFNSGSFLADEPIRRYHD
ncbi:MAG: hypothetical protein SWE60_08635 [Thermodesulfobacteriota bacterium]|nr:hypothetical protein [Thermodesulfobacteriota bacterium]